FRVLPPAFGFGEGARARFPMVVTATVAPGRWRSRLRSLRGQGGIGMSDTQAILRKIAALRARLDPAQTRATGNAAAEAREAGDPFRHLAHEVAVGARHNAMIDSTLRQLSASATPPNEAPLPPRRLTARGARLLHLGRESLHELRQLADEP